MSDYRTDDNGATPAEQAEWARSRANTYALLARLWREELDPALWGALYAAQQAGQYPQVDDLPALHAAYRRLEAALRAAGPDLPGELNVDFARLCLGSDPRRGADPYESVHRNKEGLLMQDEWEAVLELYARLGLRKRDGVHESEDHLAMELECMAQLCSRQAEAIEGGGPAAEGEFASPGEHNSPGDLAAAGFWLEQQAFMLDEHLLKWIGSFNRRVQAQGRSEFYKACADLTSAFLEADRAAIG